MLKSMPVVLYLMNISLGQISKACSMTIKKMDNIDRAKHLKISDNVSLLTVSNAFIRSTKSLENMSRVPLFER